MNIEVRIKPPHRPNTLADATITLLTEAGAITIHDCRVLRNRSGIVWASLPTYSVTVGRDYQYHPAIELPAALHRQITDAILAAYEQQESPSSGSNGGAL